MLEDFLAAKPLYYEVIDYTRMPRVYERIADSFKRIPTLHLIGTNGKGTTGRFIAAALHSLGYRVGHYSSPHILKFNERIWLSGFDVSDAELEAAHEKLQELLTPEESQALSYFEYTTLLGMLLFQECDYIVLEAGLGGEHDATAVFANDLTLVTPIDFDHQAFLGDTIEKIATTKINAVQKRMLLAKQPHDAVYEVAKKIAEAKGVSWQKTEDILDGADYSLIDEVSAHLGLEGYLKENLSHALGALKYLGVEYKRADFGASRLFGRLSPIAPNITLDVGHNPLAAVGVLKAYKQKRVTLIYNTYRDKEYEKILSIIAPIVQKVLIIEVKEARIEARERLEAVLERLGLPYGTFTLPLDSHAEYLVFGSFSVIENFLKVYR